MTQFKFDRLPQPESQAGRLIAHLITTGGDSTLGIIHALHITNPAQTVKTLKDLYGFGVRLQTLDCKSPNTNKPYAFYKFDDYGTQRALAMLDAMHGDTGRAA